MKNINVILLILFAFNWIPSHTQIVLPKLISDGVIFQSDTELKIWGWAAPKEKVELTFRENTYHAVADENGDWSMMLPAQNPGGPFEMVFRASNNISLKNILFGDIWVCSGQSNMELTMERVKEKYADIIKNSENTNIRQFLVPDSYDFKIEHKDLESGGWKSANPQNVLDFSAVAYFFAKEIYEKYHIPVGLINASLGGSPVESWMDENTLQQFPDSYRELQLFKNDNHIARIQESDKQRSENWYRELNEKDKGLIDKPDWTLPVFDDSGWDTMKVPDYWANSSIGNVNGVVWFRKEIEIPKSMVGKTAKLWLGRIVDQDFAYINGELVGTTGYQYPPRRYTVKPGILKEGKNTIVIRVINNANRGGFILDKPYYLAVDNDTIDLKGSWKYQLGATMKPLKSQTFIRWKPAGLYNNMIAPLLNFKIKGVIWYQGESNTNAPSNYRQRFSALIENWRQRWNQGDFPFIFVQLANFMEATKEPAESAWAALRQAQLQTLSVPNTGMAVTIDLGEWNDIHPLNKYDVGKRLALQAQKLAYNDHTKSSENPVPKTFVFKRKKVIITFDNTGNGIMAKGNGDLQYFSISDDGVNFVWAKAKIKGNKIQIWNDKINNPVAVRYAWANNPETANLYTKDGLPVSPFEIKKE